MTIFVSQEHRAIVVPFRPDVHNLFPHGKVIHYNGETLLSLPHGTQETRMLRNLGVAAPAPISSYYDYPGKDRPFLVQVRTASVMTTSSRCYVLNKMGTGKTRTTLWAFDFLRQSGDAHKMLVVAPLSTLKVVWEREAVETLRGVRVKILYGTREQRLKRLAEDADIYVINHDGLNTIWQQILARTDIDVMTLDEASAYRNARAERSKIAKVVVAAKPWVWALTGSPRPRAPTDAYGLAKLVTPASAPRNFTQFRNETMVQVTNFKWVERKDAAEAVTRILQPSVCFSLDDVVELPEVVERVTLVEQGPRQKAAYKELQRHAAALLKEGTITAANGAVVMNKLMQVSCGHVYTNDGKVADLDNHERMEALLDIIDGTERKVIVFASYKHAVAGIAKVLEREKIDFAVVTGDTPPNQRADIFTKFQHTNRPKVLLAHPQCMSHGLTLTAADTIAWFNPTMSLEQFEQANARFRRVGQKHKQQIFMLQGTSVEKLTYERLRHMRDAQEDVLSLLAEIAG